LYGVLVVTLAMLLRLINCRFRLSGVSTIDRQFSSGLTFLDHPVDIPVAGIELGTQPGRRGLAACWKATGVGGVGAQWSTAVAVRCAFQSPERYHCRVVLYACVW